MIRNLLTRITAIFDWERSLLEDRPSRVVTKTRNMQHHAGFDDRARTLIDIRSNPQAPIAASTVELIGMGDIQADLGDNWRLVAARAYDIAEKTIRKNLTAKDIFTRRDADTFILCFADLNKREASQITKAIVDEIKGKLFREIPEASKLQIGHRITEVEAHTANDGASMLECIAASLDAVKQEATESFERQRRVLLDDATVVFSPTWSPAQERIVVHRCLLDDWTSRSTLQSFETIAEPSELQRAIAELDYLILGRAISTLHSLLQSNSKAILLVPVNFFTLNQKNFRDDYLDLCRRVPRSCRKFMLSEIYGASSLTPVSRVIEMSQVLQPFFNAVVVGLPVTGITKFFDIAASGIYGVSISLDELPASGASILQRFAAAAKAAGLRSFVHCARTTGQLTAMVEAGIDYIDGEAVAPKVEAPKSAHSWKPLEPSRYGRL
ncbi:MAG: hypothetical protein E6Q98_23025 [Rhodospirillaceae bacterium]|nr:MAG: hypothetical protein E6Q98_23025 [Rhodospirillaceae bacterium]